MEEQINESSETSLQNTDLRAVVRGAIEEFLKAEQTRNEPAYKAELLEERKRRENLERRLNELVDENRRTRQMAEETDRSATIRAELQKLGVVKVDLAFKAVKDDITRSEDGRLTARTETGEMNLRDYLAQFVASNPELLPGRIAGGSGANAGQPQPVTSSGIDLDKIRPGMSAEELDRVRKEIARVARQSMRI
jgi:ATP/maltotriose-dependent transcriptional regulator MalT